MAEKEITSLAFQQAFLENERRSIYCVIAFVVAFSLTVAIRIFLYGSTMSPWGFLASLILVRKSWGSVESDGTRSGIATPHCFTRRESISRCNRSYCGMRMFERL